MVAVTGFKSNIPSTFDRPDAQSARGKTSIRIERAFVGNFSISTWLLIGAVLQSAILVIVPRLYAFVPAVFILMARFADTLAITFGWRRNPYLQDSIPYPVSTQIPDMNGDFSIQPASEKVVVFMLGAKSNHPLGLFAPNFKELGDHLTSMMSDLDLNKADNEFLGASNWQRSDERGATELLYITYWRSVDAIHQFAYGPIHKVAWDWWINLPASQSRHLGINHEIYAAEPGQWEAIYHNFQPTMLGATTYLRKGDKLFGGTVDDEWVSPLIDARRGKLRTSAGRLGWQPDTLHKRYDANAEANAYGH